LDIEVDTVVVMKMRLLNLTLAHDRPETEDVNK
jgi:hypothetical protein